MHREGVGAEIDPWSGCAASSGVLSPLWSRRALQFRNPQGYSTNRALGEVLAWCRQARTSLTPEEVASLRANEAEER